MGGKSVSSPSTSSNTSTENLEASSSGVLTGNLYQGKDITIQDAFSPEVQQAFGSLVDLAESAGGSALDLAKLSLNSITGVFDDLSKLSDNAIGKVSEQTTTQTQPQQAAINSLIPVIMLGIVGVSIYFIFRKR